MSTRRRPPRTVPSASCASQLSSLKENKSYNSFNHIAGLQQIYTRANRVQHGGGWPSFACARTNTLFILFFFFVNQKLSLIKSPLCWRILVPWPLPPASPAPWRARGDCFRSITSSNAMAFEYLWNGYTLWWHLTLNTLLRASGRVLTLFLLFFFIALGKRETNGNWQPGEGMHKFQTEQECEEVSEREKKKQKRECDLFVFSPPDLSIRWISTLFFLIKWRLRNYTVNCYETEFGRYGYFMSPRAPSPSTPGMSMVWAKISSRKGWIKKEEAKKNGNEKEIIERKSKFNQKIIRKKK